MNAIDALAKQVVDSAFGIHCEPGPGLLESACEACMAHELHGRGLLVERQLALPVRYRGIEIDVGYRIDLLVGGELVVELKAVAPMRPMHRARHLSHLKLSKKTLGLLVNFNVPLVKDGLHRVATNFKES